MKTLYGLYAEGSKAGETADFLTAEGATRAGPNNPDYWYVPGQSRTRVRQWLGDRSINYVTTYEFQATAADSVDDLSGHLGIKMLTPQSAKSPEPLIAKDREDFRIIANNPARELLDPVTRGVTWRPYEKYTGFSFINSATELPDPVEIPETLSLRRLENGLWDVSGDGRSIITRSNLDHLKQAGIAYSTAYLANGAIYPREKFPVFGGRAIQAAQQAGVDLVIYLPHEWVEFEPW